MCADYHRSRVVLVPKTTGSLASAALRAEGGPCCIYLLVGLACVARVLARLHVGSTRVAWLLGRMFVRWLCRVRDFVCRLPRIGGCGSLPAARACCSRIGRLCRGTRDSSRCCLRTSMMWWRGRASVRTSHGLILQHNQVHGPCGVRCDVPHRKEILTCVNFFRTAP